ncbi:ABC-2 family transporter protein [Nonomuraea coxensis DSM 45129]|uniref:ABC-2 family transporter protein n=1 Tax=Nonomuraea coxensis DSM 45129 TaxID=1122611 RepID=A0ABX8TRA0_9ACTN|nr:ABC transporter permease subunit [Nonomuraea coxensis]QYC38015.1 ABC-2 family transporter protein [Nonomuraea coxensis DSM 45129]
MIDIIRSEWTKIRSVRSTVWTLAATAVMMIGFSALLSASVAHSADGPVDVPHALALGLAGTMFGSLSIAALGVLVISGEYRTGGIRTSLMAVPRRLHLLAGKAVVFTVTAIVVCTLAAAGALAVGLAITRPAGLTAGDVVRAAGGAGLYLTACGLFGLALGTLVRHSAGALVAAIALILVLPAVVTQLPGAWGRAVAEHFTTNAGQLIMAGGGGGGSLSPWGGFGVYLAWIAVTAVAGCVLMRRRDA